MKKKAIIFGITGQDGSYLAEFLLKKNYIVHGVKRRSSSPNTERIDHIYDSVNFSKKNIFLHYGDLADSASLYRIINNVNPDEIYNLAAQSHVKISFSLPEYTADINALGTLRILEVIRNYKKKKIKFYQASSSEMFGGSIPPQNEKTTFKPRSVYAISKAFSHYAVINYREAYNIKASNGILFNHESERRGENFVTRKITRAVGRIVAGTQSELKVGNTDSLRDWGYAPEYVEAMWLMLQQEKPEDYVIGTGKQHSVQEFIDKAFSIAGLDPKDHVKIDERFMRPSEVDTLIADFSKAKNNMGWEPKYDFTKLVEKMVEHDIDLAKKESIALR